jgi:DNA-binding IclR family transcriptional regulator
VDALMIVVDEPEGATVTQIARELGLATPTVFHLVNTLVDEGLLLKFDRRYHLGPKLGVIADAFLRQNAPPPHLLGPLRRLAERTKETVYVTTWRYGDVMVLASIEGSHPLKAASPHTGYYGHAHARAAGKCLLAGIGEDALDAYVATHPLAPLTPKTITTEPELRLALEGVRERGYAVDDEEFSLGIACLAMPITFEKPTLTAFTVAGPAERLYANQAEYLARLSQAVTEAIDGVGPTAGEQR